MKKLKYLHHYPLQTQEQVHTLIRSDKLSAHLLRKYPSPHTIKNDKALFSYTMDLKNEYIKKLFSNISLNLSGTIPLPKNHLSVYGCSQ